MFVLTIVMYCIPQYLLNMKDHTFRRTKKEAKEDKEEARTNRTIICAIWSQTKYGDAGSSECVPVPHCYELTKSTASKCYNKWKLRMLNRKELKKTKAVIGNRFTCNYRPSIQ